MEKNYNDAIKNFQETLLEALKENNKEAIIKLYGKLCVFENMTLSSQDPNVRAFGYEAQKIESKAFDYLML